MGLNRNRYSSAPLMDMKKNPPDFERKDSQPPVLEQPKKPKPRRFGGLQIALSVVLPILFLAALLIPSNILRWVFIGATLLGVILMWALRAFVRDARRTLTLIYLTLCVIIGVAIVVQNAPKRKEPTRVDAASAFTGGSALDAPDLSKVDEEQAIPEEIQETPIPVSAAQARLEEFMALWAQNDTEKMLTYCTPSWLAQQEVPSRTLFTLLGFNRPTAYKIEQVYGSDAESSRPIQLVAGIAQTNGNAVSKRYQIVMQRVNDVWYVDPNSLSSIGVVEEEDEVFGQVSSILTTATATPEPAPTVNPSLTLYYNPAGGKYYHIEQNCTKSKIKPEYLPLAGKFLFSQLNDMEFKNLEPCPYCKAPARK